jgi:hypothetical protein
MAVFYLREGRCTPDTIRSTRIAVEYWRETGRIRGPKTGAFARVLRGDDEAVVLDTHMLRAFKLPIKDVRVKVRREAERRIRQAARRTGVFPAELQAMVWTGYYREYYKQGNVPRYRVETVVPF